MNPLIKVENIPEAPEPTKPQKVELPISASKMLSRRSGGRYKRIFKEEQSDKSRELPETRAKG